MFPRGDEPADSTPLHHEEREQLLPSWVATRAELNQVEFANILAARLKWRRRTLTPEKLLDDKVARDLHRDMFGEVWAWAGAYRRTDKNIGIVWYDVSASVRDLMENAKLWLASDTRSMPLDAVACRFHHRLVEIHAFPNGNGRHAREMTDLLLGVSGAEPFTWGRANLAATPAVARRNYIDALRGADRGAFAALESFVRS